MFSTFTVRISTAHALSLSVPVPTLSFSAYAYIIDGVHTSRKAESVCQLTVVSLEVSVCWCYCKVDVCKFTNI